MRWLVIRQGDLRMQSLLLVLHRRVLLVLLVLGWWCLLGRLSLLWLLLFESWCKAIERNGYNSHFLNLPYFVPYPTGSVGLDG